jgi:voltage-gated potassium channel
MSSALQEGSATSTQRGWLVTARELYNGSSRRARRFRFGMLIVDVLAIGFFAVTSVVHQEPWVIAIDIALAVLFILDFIIRYRLSEGARQFFASPGTIADAVVIVSLLASAFFANFLFLRALRILRSYRVMAELSETWPWLRANAEMAQAILNVAVFIFVTASAVFVLQVGVNPKIVDFLDALYFTITTLSTTGFGDITLVGKTGQLISILIMLVGISLFLRMLQTIFVARKVRHECPDCGLSRHELDAVHCKACGRMLAIKDDGLI